MILGLLVGGARRDANPPVEAGARRVVGTGGTAAAVLRPAGSGGSGFREIGR
jgi:hypothetical protein